MAHTPEIKARAVAMLLTGDTAYYVSKQTGVPLTTVKRWRSEWFAEMRVIIGNPLAEASCILRRK